MHIYDANMFIRVVKSKGYSYARLVENYRDSTTGKTKQRVICNLCRLDPPDPKATALKTFFQQYWAFDNNSEKIVVEVSKDYGHVVFLHEIWLELGLDQALNSALKASRRDATKTEKLIRLMVFCQICAPTSKLGILKWLEDAKIPGIPANVTHQMLLRAMDALVNNFPAVKDAISSMILPLVDRDYTLALYDLTTVRAAGKSEVDNDLRQFGKSKETGGFDRQFLYGVMQNRDGLPLMYQIHQGNVAETKTFSGAISTLLEQYPINRIIVVADRGLLSEKNLTKLPNLGKIGEQTVQFILAVPLRKYSETRMILSNRDFAEDGIIEKTFLNHRLVVSYNAKIAREQTLNRRKQIEQIEQHAETLLTHIEVVKTRTPRQDQKAVNKIKAQAKSLNLSRIVKAAIKDEKFTFWVEHSALEEAEKLDGLLALSTNVYDLDAETIIDHYKSRADIESGFRTLKSEIQIAPVRHWVPNRIDAHGMICYLALVIHRVIRSKLRARGVSNSVKDVLRTLAQVKYVELSLNKQKITGLTKKTEEQLSLIHLFELDKLKDID